MSELKEIKKVKVVALYEQTPKPFEPDPNPQKSFFFATKKHEKSFELKKLKTRIERDIKDICCSAT